MLKELAKQDDKWRQIALMITKGNKATADDIVNEMYLRRYDNDRGQPTTEYYILLTLKSIYLNQIKTNREICVEEIRDTQQNNTYELTDEDKQILDRYSNLTFTEQELIELSFDHSLRDIEKKYQINYGYAHGVITKARKKILQERIGEYNNKRLKHRKMKSKGLGDTIEKITKFTGIKALIDKMNIDCGCDERKEYLNKVFKYKKKPRCLTEEEIQSYAEFVRERKFNPEGQNKASGKFEHHELKYIIGLYNSVFSTTISVTCYNCGGTAKMVIGLVNDLDKVYLNNLPKPKQTRNRKTKVEEVSNEQ